MYVQYISLKDVHTHSNMYTLSQHKVIFVPVLMKHNYYQ